LFALLLASSQLLACAFHFICSDLLVAGSRCVVALPVSDRNNTIGPWIIHFLEDIAPRMASWQRLFRAKGLPDAFSDDDVLLATKKSAVILVVASAVAIGAYFQIFGSSSAKPATPKPTATIAQEGSNTSTHSSKESHPPLLDGDSSTDDSNSNSAVRKAASGTLWSILVKLLSFLCTQQAFRMLDDNIAALGRAAIQLELLLTTILFVSREGFRLSLTKGGGSTTNDDNWNVAWLSIPVSVVASTMALLWHLYYSSSPPNNDKDEADLDYRLGGMLYCMAAVVEGLAEPAALHALRQMDVATRVSAEGIASMCKTLATVVALKQWLPEWPIFSFGVAQLTYALVYAIFLYSKTWRQLKRPNLAAGLDTSTCYLTLLFTIQGLFKHFLTESDRIVLSTLADGYDQGIYAMASAYGGLAARFLLQPIEETARLLWSRVSGDTSSSLLLEQSYVVLVKLVLYIGLTFCCLATNYTSIVLYILAGTKWGSKDEAVTVLSAFCVYTAFLAWNGMTEAFVFGVASSGGDIGRLGIMHSVVGVVFAILAPLAVTKFGTVGVVAANCTCMALRSLYSVSFAANYFADRRNQGKDKHEKTWTTTIAMLRILLGKMLPHPAVLACFAASAVATNKSLQWLLSHDVSLGSREWLVLALKHVVFGGMWFVGICSVAFPLESEFRQSSRQLLRPKQD
jgi:oligosaccharide translocation protein RFT1